MVKHARIPAIAAIGITAVLGVGLMAATGQFKRTNLSQASLEELEKMIVNCSDGNVWDAYGDKLRQAGKYKDAAKAYARALELQPDLREAAMGEGIALAKAGDADAFFHYAYGLSGSQPKVAVDLLAQPEVAVMRSDPQWGNLEASAKAQAVD